MKCPKFDTIIREYMQHCGWTELPEEVSQAFMKLLELCDRWERNGYADGQAGRFEPPGSWNCKEDMKDVIALLHDIYMSGFNSGKAAS